jgi:hypothetical protein
MGNGDDGNESNQPHRFLPLNKSPETLREKAASIFFCIQ